MATADRGITDSHSVQACSCPVCSVPGQYILDSISRETRYECLSISQLHQDLLTSPACLMVCCMMHLFSGAIYMLHIWSVCNCLLLVCLTAALTDACKWPTGHAASSRFFVQEIHMSYDIYDTSDMLDLTCSKRACLSQYEHLCLFCPPPQRQAPSANYLANCTVTLPTDSAVLYTCRSITSGCVECPILDSQGRMSNRGSMSTAYCISRDITTRAHSQPLPKQT